MSSLLNADEKDPKGPAAPPPAGTPIWMAAALAILALVAGFLLYGHFTTNALLQARLKEANDKMAATDKRTTVLEGALSDARAKLDVTSEKLGLTVEELERAQKLAEQNRREQQTLDKRLTGEIATQKSELTNLTGALGGVEGNLSSARRDLDRTIGDLGIQSGLIARNKEELEELKKRGERDYLEFDLPKSKQFTKVGPVALRLDKAEPKKSKYTMILLSDDKQIEKKDKTLLEPVQFYSLGNRALREIVVYDIKENRITGYLSLPKEPAKPQS